MFRRTLYLDLLISAWVFITFKYFKSIICIGSLHGEYSSCTFMYLYTNIKKLMFNFHIEIGFLALGLCRLVESFPISKEIAFNVERCVEIQLIDWFVRSEYVFCASEYMYITEISHSTFEHVTM